MNSFIGIDLGTTFSVVAKTDEHGKPVIVKGKDGESLVPSAVYRYKDGKIEVGKFARNDACEETAAEGNSAMCFKRDMGEEKVYKLRGKEYTPTDLSAEVLKHLILDRAEQLGEIAEVVVTVPANFSNQAREATLEAARRADLKVNYVINEPTAAALCYSVKEGMNLEGTYAVYDLGGGTFDISIINIAGKDVEVLVSNGIHELGGIDFDQALKNLVEEKYESASGEKIEEGDYNLQRAEEDKKELSKRETKTTRVNRKAITVTREEFDELISAKVTQAEMLCESTLQEAGLKPSDIKGVLCAGGSTRIPQVQASIKRVFHQEPIFKANVDEVVALGAAFYAIYKGDTKKMSAAQKKAVASVEFTERTNKCFGTIAVDFEENRLANSVLIKKNTVIPCEKTHTYYTAVEGQTTVNCRLTESISEETDLDFVTEVQSVPLHLPPGRAANQPIEVTYRYDENQTMHCVYKDVETGKEVSITRKVSATDKVDADVNEFTVE